MALRGVVSGPVFRAVVDNTAGAGDITVVAAAGAGKGIRLLGCRITESSSTDRTLRFESGAGGTSLTGQMVANNSTPLDLPFCEYGYGDTAANTLLNLEHSGAGNVAGVVWYQVFDLSQTVGNLGSFG